VSDRTLSGVLADLGYTHTKGAISGKRAIYRGADLVGEFAWWQAWIWLFETGQAPVPDDPKLERFVDFLCDRGLPESLRSGRRDQGAAA